jgi:uncharacterized protein (DUF58 family)
VAGPIPFHELFDAEFLEGVGRLRLVARRVPPGGRFAEQRSRDMGHGLEFQDYRPYTPGDDLRAIDWNVYLRLGRVFLRLFEELEDLPLYLLTDLSASMWLEEPPRAKKALRTTLALAAVALGQHDSAGVFSFSSDLSIALRPQAGKDRIMTFARRLAELEPGGPTDTARAVRRLNAMGLRRGVLAVVSDFFDPAGLEAVLVALKRTRHRLMLVQLLRKSDREPLVEGDVRLRDCETGVTEDVSVTPAVLARYRDAYDQFQDGLTSFCKQRGAGLLRVDCDVPLLPQLAQVFESGAYTV